MPIDTKIHRHYWDEEVWWKEEDYVDYPVLTYKTHYLRTKTGNSTSADLEVEV